MYQLAYRFLEYLATVPDVYFVTVQEALEYIKNPVPISEIESFKPFGCDHLPRPDGCRYSPSCRFELHLQKQALFGSFQKKNSMLTRLLCH